MKSKKVNTNLTNTTVIDKAENAKVLLSNAAIEVEVLLEKARVTSEKLLAQEVIAAHKLIATDRIVADEISSHTIIVNKLNVLHKKHTNTVVFTLALLASIIFIAGGLLILRPKVNHIEEQVSESFTLIKQLAKNDELQTYRDSVFRDELQHLPTGAPISALNVKRVSSTFGYRTNPITGKKEYHKALDIAAAQGSITYAVASGIVEQAKFVSGYGNQIRVKCGNGYSYWVSHLDSMFVFTGTTVKQGQPIGTVGMTGSTTGPHEDLRMFYQGENFNPSLFTKL